MLLYALLPRRDGPSLWVPRRRQGHPRRTRGRTPSRTSVTAPSSPHAAGRAELRHGSRLGTSAIPAAGPRYPGATSSGAATRAPVSGRLCARQSERAAPRLPAVCAVYLGASPRPSAELTRATPWAQLVCHTVELAGAYGSSVWAFAVAWCCMVSRVSTGIQEKNAGCSAVSQPSTTVASVRCKTPDSFVALL